MHNPGNNTVEPRLREPAKTDHSSEIFVVIVACRGHSTSDQANNKWGKSNV
ncbi:hypothetical protein TH47_00240 [Thalassospira sp. MCCC 1A02803]|nr:hypothetical protein TH47_00240 [Thalassospira sp. MCCC 1A02803]